MKKKLKKETLKWLKQFKSQEEQNRYFKEVARGIEKVSDEAHKRLLDGREHDKALEEIRPLIGEHLFEILNQATCIIRYGTSDELEADSLVAERLHKKGLLSSDQHCLNPSVIGLYKRLVEESERFLRLYQWRIDPETKHITHKSKRRRIGLLSKIIEPLVRKGGYTNCDRDRDRIAWILRPYLPADLLNTAKGSELYNAVERAQRLKKPKIRRSAEN